MKLLGLIGGVSPQSTQIYYRLLNEAARRRLGAEHSARMIIYALDYGEMVVLYDRSDWTGYAERVAQAGVALKMAGADALMIGSNTSHIGADAARDAAGLPLIHIMDAAATALEKAGAKRPLFLGTPATMSGDFYQPAFRERYSGETILPNADEQEEVGRIIFEELVNGDVRDASRARLLAFIDRSRGEDGADAVILGCTELCMIIDPSACPAPVFDTTALHAAAGAHFMLSGD